MSGVDGLPLLILDRVGKGRVAQLFSDQLWMWSKGFEGGGPHAELIRRIGHWLMQEPDLEEEDLRATVIDGRLEIRRQSLTTRTEEVTVTRPDGTTETVKLRDDGRGRATGSIAAAEQGLYKVTDGSAPGVRRLRRAQFQGMVRPARQRRPCCSRWSTRPTAACRRSASTASRPGAACRSTARWPAAAGSACARTPTTP